MAQKIIRISDLSDEVLADTDTTLVWGFDGKTLEIDLTAAERGKFEKALARYLEVSRPASRSAKATASAATSNGRRAGGQPQVTGTPLDDLKGVDRTRKLEEIRAWAIERDIKVNARGRLALEVVQAYYADPDNN